MSKAKKIVAIILMLLSGLPSMLTGALSENNSEDRSTTLQAQASCNRYLYGVYFNGKLCVGCWYVGGNCFACSNTGWSC